MAVFPQGLSHIDARCNAGERRVLHQLKRCLEDDYLVWHDVPIGPRARQPDFVVLSPRWGVLLLEVKDWKRGTLGAATRDSVELHTPRGRVTAAHPLRQARDVALELVDLMRGDPALVHDDGPFAGRLLFPYGWGVVMSGLRRTDVDSAGGSDFDTLFPPERTLLRDDLDEAVEPMVFQRRLWGLFTVSYPYTLTLPQRDRIRWHLFPELRVQAQGTLDFAAGTDAVPSLPSLLQVMDLQQEQVARTLGEGHRVIHGAAGSGKTMILVYRAQYLAATARPERPILVMCFNKALAGRLDALLRERGVDERVQVRTFHAWCLDLLRSYQIDVVAPELKRFTEPWFAAVADTVAQAVDRGRVPGGQYHALLLDEAHDFEDAWLRIAARMVAPETNSLLVLYDDAQSIYRTRRGRRRLNFASLGIEARGRTSILRLNYRNTAEVLSLAMACARHLLDDASGAAGSDDEVPLVKPATAGRRGPMPVLGRLATPLAEAEWLAEGALAALREGLRQSQLVVLAPMKQQLHAIATQLRRLGLVVQSQHEEDFRRFDWQVECIKLMTLHAAKGLEFPWVAIAGLQALPLQHDSEDDALRLLYVAMTRSTERLLLSASADSALVVRVERALQEVAWQLALDGASRH